MTGPRKRASKRASQQQRDEIELATLPTLDNDGGASPFVTLSPTEERRERELEDILSELGTDARLKVWQVIDGKSSYAGDMSADGFSLDALLDAFGGGDKRLVIMQGRTRVDTVSVSLDPSIPPKNPRQPKALANGNGAAPVGVELMMSMMAQQSRQASDNATMMSTMMAGIVGALTTVMSATKPADPLASFAQIATILKPNGNGGSVSEAMTMFREGMSLAERYAGKDDDDGVMTVVEKGLDTLGVLVKGIVDERKAAAMRQIPANATVGDVASNPEHEDTNPVAPSFQSVRPWVDAVRPHIAQLVTASKFLPPTAAAETINKLLSDDEFFDLIDDINDQDGGGFGVRLSAYFPGTLDGVKPEWIGEVLRVLLTDYAEPDDTQPAPDATTNGAGGAP